MGDLLHDLADDWWEESQRSDTIIHDAGILQRCATELRAALDSREDARASLRRLDDLGSDRLTCWQCEGRGWIRNGEIEDGMMTGGDNCPPCRGSGQVSKRMLEAEIDRMRQVARR